MTTAIFLGAGASAAEGAPVQSNLFKDYFELVRKPTFIQEGGSTRLEMKEELTRFFKTIFFVDVEVTPLDEIRFPTFEEALGVLDLAESRREAFKQYELEDFGRYGNRIRRVRQYLVLAMATVIDASLKTSNQLHSKMIANLQGANLLQSTMFISTNYDILIDNALSSLSEVRPGANLDYGIEFANFTGGDWSRPDPSAVPLYKLHGSLNWLYCPTCNCLTLTPNVKGVMDLITDLPRDRDRAVCKCNSIMNPIIVPPTFYKDMSRVFLSVIWNKAENALREANHIIFCGYSFPDADMHIKYLLKRSQVNRSNPATLRFTVVNNKNQNPKYKEERARYRRFLSKAAVTYTDSSFEQFTQAPQSFYHAGS